ncbi:PREDICTED: protein transport protein Sec61 subunit gamma-like isoform X2 [Prunus mume]|nr:PREDICTED: protein transport protein Sec61 subunit gamma-like isoform X2 [Prunus mume]
MRLNFVFDYVSISLHISHSFSHPICSEKMDAIDLVVDPLIEFSKDNIRLVKRCCNPDRKEFVMMGFVGFFMKLIFIPINNVLLDLFR